MNLAIDRALCFADAKGRPSRRVEKRTTKLLAKVSPILERIMEPDEQIVGAAPACSPFSTLEFLTTGYIITAIKRCVLVITDRRMLHLPTKSNSSPRGSISQVRFADVESASAKGLLAKELKLVYRDGRKEGFSGLDRASARRFGAWIAERAGQGAPSAVGGRHFLCPECARALAEADDRCGGCGFAFRNRKKALRYSLAFPGGGYFYTGHPVMGVLDALVEGFLILTIVSGVGLAMAGEPDMWPGLAILAAALGFEKLITVYHASHYVSEFLPARAAAPATTQPS